MLPISWPFTKRMHSILRAGFFIISVMMAVSMTKTRGIWSARPALCNYANAFMQTGKPHYRDWAAHGFSYLTTHHRCDDGHYIWQRNGSMIEDGRAMVYGHAFVMLAAALPDPPSRLHSVRRSSRGQEWTAARGLIAILKAGFIKPCPAL